MQINKRVLIFALFLSGIFENTFSQSLPANFFIENATPDATFEAPTAIAFAPDGRIFVAEQGGRVFIIQNGVKLAAPFIDLRIEVLSYVELGLLGIVLDPNFQTNRYVYLLYAVDPDGDGVDDHAETFGRLVRYTAGAANPNVADLSSRFILIGANWSEGIPMCHHSHGIGSIRFGSDGTLLFSSGDAAPTTPHDAGGNHPNCFGPGKLSADQDIGSFRAQYLGSMAGKVLRIDPATGSGLPSNPYYTGNAADIRSKVWAYGFRNPFRFAVRPNGSANPNDGQPGTLYIGDVGWGQYEDLNVSKDGGENFGWPCFEGPRRLSDYQSLDPPNGSCSSMGSSQNPAEHTLPFMHWHHSDPAKSSPQGPIGATAIGGVFYTGSFYPGAYQNALFFGDFIGGWIRVLKVDQNDKLVSVQNFATGLAGLVDLQIHPVTKNVFYADVVQGKIFEIKYGTTNQNHAPVAVISADHLSGDAPLTVQFQGSDSFDPDQTSISHLWNFGDGATSTQPDPQHTYNTPGSYKARLTVFDPQGLTGVDSLSILVSNPDDTTPPTISDVSATNITSVSAVIQWTTDEPADSRIDYGTSTSYGTTTPLDASFVSNHFVTLGNLTANTTYHFRARSTDAAGNLATSGDFTFKTSPALVTISGTVVNAVNGQPISGAKVGLQSQGNPVLTNASGNFTLSNVPSADATITAAKGGFYTGIGFVNDPNASLTISLDPIAFEQNLNYTFREPEACTSCHTQKVNQWSGSPMSESGMNRWVHDVYSGTGTPGGQGGFVYTRDSVHRTARPNAECASCHNPTEWAKNPHNVNMGDINNPTAGMLQGVQCEVCHRIYEKDEGKINSPGVYPGAVTIVMPSQPTALQFGALGDAFVAGNQVMRPAYNPNLRANVCATCHEDNNDHDDDGDYEEPGSVSVEPTYEEWKATPYAVLGSGYQDCVDCHMPPYGADYFCSEAQIPRDPNTIRSHDIHGTTPGFLENAVTMQTTTEIVDNNLRVRVKITNDRAGHHVPTGVSIRNMILLVDAKSAGTNQPLTYVGTQTIHALGGVGNPQQGYYAGLPGKIYAKSHSNGTDDGVFYTEATSISWDTRIPALQTDETIYDFALPESGGAVNVSSKLIYRRAFRSYVDAKGWTSTGHGAPLPDVQAPHFGHLMESNALSVNLPNTSGGYALKFDGSNDFLQIEDNALLSGGPGKNITVEAWVKPDLITGAFPIAHKYLDGKTKDWGMQIFDGALEIGIESNGDNWSFETGSIAPQTWTHVAFAFDNAANIVRLFVNGIEVGQKALTKDMIDSPAVIRIGRHGYSDSYFAGEIEELRIWNVARTGAQISATMNQTLIGNEPGLIGYWQFDEGSGQSAGDQTNNGNNARLGTSAGSDTGDPAWVNSTAPFAGAITSLQLTSPNGGESWTVGSNQSIAWNSQGAIANVKLEYSTNAGASWTTIISNTANDGNYSWTVPNAVSTNCVIRISDAADGNPLDASDATFSIEPAAPATPSITVFSPASGQANTEVTIAGNNFTGATSVQFNNVPASGFNIDSATQLRAIVPASATTGKISVTTAAGTAISANDFTITNGGGVGEALSFQPSDDAYVRSSSATKNYGRIATLRVRKTSSETLYSFLKFPVFDLAGPVQHATLRLLVTDDGPDGGDLFLVSNNYKDSNTPWTQQGLNWNNAPSMAGASLSTIGPVSDGSWVEIDVTSVIAGNGVYSFGIKNNSSNVVSYVAQEGAEKPRLIIETGTGGPQPLPPIISGFSPASGIAGIEITIVGNNFNEATNVTFNGVAAAFAIDGATQIRATVPNGATSGKVGVTTPVGAALSANDFVVTTAGGTTTTLSFTPLHDAYVRSSAATSSYGGVSTLRVRKSGSEALYSYLKFEVSGIGGAVQNAKLRLYVTDGSNDGGVVHSVSNNYQGTSTAWQQNGLNWNNAPEISGIELAEVGAVSAGNWVEIDVTSAITGNGMFSFGLMNSSSDVVYYDSQEGANKPRLVISVGASARVVAHEEQEKEVEALPSEFGLIRNYPNPFNGYTIIEYALPEASWVSINIYNMLGQLVRTLVDENVPAGWQRTIWDGKGYDRRNIGSGIYFYELRAGGRRFVGRMILQQ